MAIKHAPSPTVRRPRKKPASLARRRADPGLRSKLPASQLTGAQRKERTRLQTVAREDRNPLYDPTTQLAGHALIQASRDIADLDIRPQVDAQARNLRSTTIQGSALAQRSSDYYRQLAAEEAKGVATQKALAGMLNQQTAQVGLSTQQAYDQMGAQEQQRQASDTEARGTGLGGDTSRVPEELAAARGSATNLQQAGAERAAAQGAGWAELAASMAQARQLHGGEMQDQLLNRMANQQQDIRGKIADIESTRGDLTTKALTGLRQQGFENLVTQAGLDLKTADLQAQIEGTKAQATAAQAKTDLETKKFKADQAWKKINATSAADKLKATTAYNNARIDIQRGIDPVTGKRLPKDRKGKSSADRLNDFKLDYARKHGYLPPTGAPKPSSSTKNNPTGAKWRTPEQSQKFYTDVDRVVSVAKKLGANPNMTQGQRRQIAERIMADPKNPGGLAVSVALDKIIGHLAPANVDRLHANRIPVAVGGIPTRRNAPRRPRRRSTRPASSVPGIGGLLGS